MARVIACVALLVAACSPEYAYVPAQNATAAIDGHAAADYPIPRDAPTGDVRIATFGIAELRRTDGDQQIHAIHLRLSVADNSDHPWTVNTRDQRLDLEDHGMSAPAFASADPSGAAPPLVSVAAGGKRDVDLFFPLPPDLDGAEDLPAFDALWRVNTGTETVAERTPFERIAISDAPPPYDADVVWGAWPYWYDPMYAGWGVTIAPGYWGGPIMVHRWGHPHYGRGGAGFHGGGFHGGAGFHGGGFHGGAGFHGGGFHGGGGHGGGHR